MDDERNRIRPWADMPIELLTIILSYTVLMPDYIRFGRVCRNWNQVAREQQNERMIEAEQQPPMMFVPTSPPNRTGRLFSLPERRLYIRLLEFPFDTRCCGATYGWWAFPQQGPHLNIFLTLLNPFSGRRIDLPTIDQQPNIGYLALRFPERIFIKKILLSCNPTLHPEGWIAAAIHGGQVSFFIQGQNEWRTLSTGFERVNDACFHQGHLYLLVDQSCRIISIDMMLIREGNPAGPDAFRRYPIHVLRPVMIRHIVSCGEDLLVVSGYLPIHGRAWFRIRRMLENGWQDVWNLGTYSLFLEEVSSTSANVSRIPNCSANSIYYIYHNYNPDQYDLPNDIGVYNIQTRDINTFYEPHNRRIQPHQVWLHPQLGHMEG